MKRAALFTAAAGLAVAALTWAAIATTRGWPAAVPRHLLYYVAAGVAWAGAVALVPRLPSSRAQLLAALVTARGVLWLTLADRRRAVIWLWSPLVVIELGLNAHVDALGVALFVAALIACQRRRAALAG